MRIFAFYLAAELEKGYWRGSANTRFSAHKKFPIKDFFKKIIRVGYFIKFYKNDILQHIFAILGY